ncbi:MAG: chromosomal replication initiator protein DnaA, partial [Parcubacteria group bacterium]|nr:chromosomal replication initiator protein DnaA [Parcubacteria group bacterium]
MDTKKIWQTALGELEVVLSKANFTTWFKNSFIYEYDEKNNRIIIGVPNNFCKEWLEKKYNKQIQETLSKLVLNLKKIEYKVTTKESIIPINLTGNEQIENQKDIKQDENFYINNKYTFENFIVGNSNRLAFATAQAVANKPGLAYNPFFIYGGIGLGKTHLSQAIGNEIKNKYPKKKIVYVSCEQFTNEFVQAISNGKINQFKKKYRDADVLLVDDIQFLSHKEGTQEEFFHTFNALHQSNRQIVLTADRQPQSLSEIAKRLTSRFAGGMVADIKQPNYETRIAILKTKSEKLKFNINQEILEYVAQNIQSNIRELEGALNKIYTHCQLYQESPSLDLVIKLLEDIITSAQTKISSNKIFEVVATFFTINN